MFSNNRKSKKSIHFEIIPMIDVMMILVLFLAVMAFLPTVQSAIQTDLPKSGTKDKVSAEDLLVNINKTGGYSVNHEDVGSFSEVLPAVQANMQDDDERRIVIAADKSLNYEIVVQLLSSLKEAGFRNVALATEAKKDNVP